MKSTPCLLSAPPLQGGGAATSLAQIPFVTGWDGGGGQQAWLHPWGVPTTGAFAHNQKVEWLVSGPAKARGRCPGLFLFNLILFHECVSACPSPSVLSGSLGGASSPPALPLPCFLPLSPVTSHPSEPGRGLSGQAGAWGNLAQPTSPRPLLRLPVLPLPFLK